MLEELDGKYHCLQITFAFVLALQTVFSTSTVYVFGNLLYLDLFASLLMRPTMFSVLSFIVYMG